MNCGIHFNMACLKADKIWDKISKTHKWTLMGMWDQEDEAIYQEMLAADKSTKPSPNFIRHNKEAKKKSDENRAQRKKAKRSRNEDGDAEPMEFYSAGGKRERETAK